MNVRKAQTATEYIIIVAVVIVIALVVVQIMGGFPGIGSSTSKKVSDYKLSSNDQIGISKYYFTEDFMVATINNNYFESLRVENLTVNGIICNSSNTNLSGTATIGLPLTLNPGQSITINCSDGNFSTTQNDVTPQVSITYTNPTTGATYTSTIGSYSATLSSNSGNQTQNQTPQYTPNASVLSLRQGLVAYYSFDGNTLDDSSNGNNATNNGANYTTSGKLGGAYQFNGNGNNINAPDSTSLNIVGKNITISAWIKTITPKSYAGIVYKGNGGSNGYIIAPVTNAKFWLNGVTPATGPSSTENGSWHHVVGTYDGSNIITYTDGIAGTPVVSSLTIVSSAGYPLIIGRDTYSQPSRDYNGYIDEVSIWNRSLNATEISQLYNNGTGLSLSLSGPLAPTCSADQISCSGTNFFNCTNGNFVNNGNVAGQCGYVIANPALATGLVAYFPFDANISDMSGNRNTGNNSGTTLNATGGKYNGAEYFNGASSINLTTLVPQSSDYSITAWIKTISPIGTIFSQEWDGNHEVRMDLYNGYLRFVTYEGGYRFIQGNKYTIDDNQWHKVTVIKKGLLGYVYVDNKFENSGLVYNVLTNDRASIGSLRYTAGQTSYFTGLIDEVRIYNRTLVTPETIKEIDDMDLNNAPIPRSVLASSEQSAVYAAYRAFDGDNISSYSWNTIQPCPALNPGWIKYDFGNGYNKTAVGYSIMENQYQGYHPGAWKFLASNDNTTWTTLDTRSGITWCGGANCNTNPQTQYFNFANSQAYRYYMLNFTALDAYNQMTINEIKINYTENNNYINELLSIQ